MKTARNLLILNFAFSAMLLFIMAASGYLKRLPFWAIAIAAVWFAESGMLLNDQLFGKSDHYKTKMT